ncbi:MAG: gfo/Idh/MocA family oxidoreductase, partial [Chloroflexi bacterium]
MPGRKKMTMENQRTIRLAVIGIGNIGQAHVAHINALPDMELVAVCDIDHARADSAAQQYGADAYYNYQDLLNSAAPDGIVVATPHYEHVQMTIDALTRGVHVLVEKPIAVHAKEARKMVAAYEEALKTKPDLVFAAMFMQRTYGYWQKIREMITGG